METTGTFEYCRKVLHTLGERAKNLVEELEKDVEESEKKSGVKLILDMMAV